MMPTVTAIALETVLEPGSASSVSSTSHHHRRSRTAGVSHKPAPSRSDSPPPKDNRRRPCTGAVATTSPASSPKLRQPRRNEQQPVFLYRRQQQRPPSTAATGSERSAGRHGTGGLGTASGGGGKNDQSPLAGGGRTDHSIKGYCISPKLYATPESTRIVPTGPVHSSSPTSDLSPSPYVVNHKRRDISRPSAPPPATPVADEGNDVERKADMEPRPLDRGSGNAAGDEAGGGGGQPGEGSAAGTGAQGNAFDTVRNGDALDENKPPDTDAHNDEEDDDFLDSRELMSAVSCSDTEDGSSFGQTPAGISRTPLTNQSEFCDATEDFFSDGSDSHSSSSFRANIEADLSSIRLDLSEEKDKRKKVEEALTLMKNMLLRIASQLSQLGVSLPPMQLGGELQYDMDSMAQICQEVVVTRIVFEAVEIGLGHAEAQAAAEAVVEAKNHEIAHLRGRLHYYEAMNREMSLRNQAAIELTRCRHLGRNVWRKWVWGCAGLSITIGASLLVYSYLPHGGRTLSLASSECHDTSLDMIEYEGSPI